MVLVIFERVSFVVHEVWVANIMTPAVCKKRGAFHKKTIFFWKKQGVSPRFAADIKNGRTCF